MTIDTTDETVFAEAFFSHFSDTLGPYLECAGIPNAVLTDPSLRISLRQFVEVLEVAARERGEDHLGLRLGEQINQEDLGVLGHALTHAATVEQLLLTTARNVAVYTTGVDITLSPGEKYASFSYQLTDPSIINRRQDAEFTLSLLHTLVDRCTGGTWYLHEVHFEHARPRDTSPHKCTFVAPVRFDKPCNALVFDMKLLGEPLITADLRLFPVLEDYLAQALQERSQEKNIVARIFRNLARSLSSGVPSLEETAETLGMPRWTLQRRLKAKGLTYKQLVADTRQQLAEEYLSKTDMPLKEVSFMLGYSEIGAFSRAFSRWTGMPPQVYRNQHNEAN
jgi:AraC-like DNA-binding protein